MFKHLLDELRASNVKLYNYLLFLLFPYHEFHFKVYYNFL